jgi:leader peptidase (prepilin peptidase)/N-methyltransferase
MNAETFVVVATLAGVVAGALLPRLIALIPDREPATAQAVPATGEHAAGQTTPYRALAAAPHLPWYLAVASGGLWAALVARVGGDAILAAALLVVTLGVAMAYIDVREHRLPDWLTYPAFAGAALALAVAATLTGDWSAYGRAWAGAIVLAGAFVVLALARPGELGFGDVKLVASLGLLLGWIGWGHVVLGAFLSFLLGGVLSIVLLSLRRAGRRTAIPFGPFLLAGTFIAIGWGDVLLDAYLG